MVVVVRRVVGNGRRVVVATCLLKFEDELDDDEDESEMALIEGSSAISLQKGVVQRHALMLEAPGSEISRMLQSSVGSSGSVNVPRSTLVGKHSLKTDVSVGDFSQAYSKQASLGAQVWTCSGSLLLNLSHVRLGSRRLPHEKHWSGLFSRSDGLGAGVLGLLGLMTGLFVGFGLREGGLGVGILFRTVSGEVLLGDGRRWLLGEGRGLDCVCC